MNAQRKVHGHRYQPERRDNGTQPNATQDSWVSSIHNVVAHIKTIELRIARRVYTNGRQQMPVKKAPPYLRCLEHATLIFRRIARISVGADVESAATCRVYFPRPLRIGPAAYRPRFSTSTKSERMFISDLNCTNIRRG